VKLVFHFLNTLKNILVIQTDDNALAIFFCWRFSVVHHNSSWI